MNDLEDGKRETEKDFNETMTDVLCDVIIKKLLSYIN